MQPIEDRVCDDTTICLGCSRHGLFLPKALVRPSLVEEADVLRDEAQQMVLPEHEHMVEQFAPQSADEALGEGVHVRCPDRGASDLCTDGLEQRCKRSAQLSVGIDDEHFGLSIQRCVSRLLRTPIIGRRPGDCSMDDSPPLEIYEEQDEEGPEERSVTPLSACGSRRGAGGSNLASRTRADVARPLLRATPAHRPQARTSAPKSRSSSFDPSGVPQPVQASQPGLAAKAPLSPAVMSWNAALRIVEL